jgi:hypothetical protein
MHTGTLIENPEWKIVMINGFDMAP